MRAFTSWLLLVWGCLLGLAPTGPVWGQTPKPQWIWAKTGGGAANRPWQELGKRLEVDAAGNTYVLGSYTDTAHFDNVILNGVEPAGYSSFIAKYDATGALQWIHGSRNLAVFDLALDPAGDCYALVKGDTLGGSVLPAGALSLVRFLPNGRVGLRRTVSPRIEDSNIRLAIDRRGRFYVAGSYSRTTVIGPDTLRAFPAQAPPADTLGHRRAFVACFNFSWARQWVVSSGGGAHQDHRVGMVQVDAAGNAYGLVNFSDTIAAGATTLVSTRPSGSFEQAVMKITAGGQFAWMQHVVKNSSGAVLTGLAVDSAGNSYVAGAYRGQGLFGSSTLTTVQPNAYQYYLVKYDAAGQQQWVREVRATAPPSGLSSRAGVALDRMGYPYQTGGITGQVVFGADTLGASPLQGGSAIRAFVVKYSPAGQEVWGLNSGSASAEVMLNSLAFDGRGQGYLTGGFTNTVRLGATLLTSRGGSDVLVGKISRDTVGTGPTYPFYDLGGRLFEDVNSNGQWDAGESPYPGPIVVEVLPGPFYLTAINGQFAGRVPDGTYTLRIPYVPAYHTVTTPVQTATFTTPGQVDTTNHFGLHLQRIPDLRVDLTPGWGFVPGRNASYTLTCQNVGTFPQDGTVTLTLDPRLRFLGSQPTPPATSTGHTFTWNVTALAPQQQVSWQINVRVDSTLRTGNMLTSVAQATLPPGIVDVNPADNIDTTRVGVRTSYDPNDKQVSHAQLTPSQVQSGQWLTYTVRFQNTGNAEALRVRIVDTLSATLQRASIQVLAASHNMQWQLKGPGVAEFSFLNINLPDSASDEPGSHGFVRYRVLVNPTLVVGDSVPNTAHIYFDFNPAVVTNTAVTYLRSTTGLNSAAARLPLALFPNPAHEQVRLNLTATTAGPLHVQACNALGQVVWHEASVVAAGPVSRTLPARGWAPGVYTVQVQCGALVSTQRLVVAP